MTSKLRIVTWNIHKGDRDGSGLPPGPGDARSRETGSRTSSASRRSTRGCRAPGGTARASAWRASSDTAHSALGLNVKVKGGAYGNLTLSRFPLKRRAQHGPDDPAEEAAERSRRSRHDRTAARVAWWPTSHLGLIHLERRVQVRRLLAHLFAGARPDQPLVDRGDWNEWGKGSCERSCGSGGSTSPVPTSAPWGRRRGRAADRSSRSTRSCTATRLRCHHVVRVLDRGHARGERSPAADGRAPGAQADPPGAAASRSRRRASRSVRRPSRVSSGVGTRAKRT